MQPQGKAPNGKKGGKKNKDLVLAVLALILVVALAITILVCCIKAIVDTVNKNNNTTGNTITTTGTTGTTAATDPVYPTPAPGAWNEGFVTLSKPNTAIHEGDIILVNGDHAYTFPSSLQLVEMLNKSYGWGTVYVLGNGMTYPDGTQKPVELSRRVVADLTAMLADMKAANSTLTDTRRLMILSGYRTPEKQQELYENETVEGLTAKPGHSEHHTGLTFDIRISVKDKPEIEYLNDTEQAWITENCAKYGFILRYTDDNKDITGILNEDWHFRYVGKAHASYMAENDLCLEEYVDMLRKNHHYGLQEPLNYKVGETEYTIYYFPASVENDTTTIYVPSSNYEISGNNVDGFIITITK